MMSTSAWPTPTVSSKTSSLPLASISSAAWRVASDSPPSDPRLAMERMNTPGSRKWSANRIRSPSRAPWVNGELGSIESTATWRSRARACSIRRPISVDLPTPGGPVKPTTAARPVLGYTSRTSAQPSGSSFSTSEMARASARLSPSSRRWARSAAVRPGAAMGRESYGRGTRRPSSVEGRARVLLVVRSAVLIQNPQVQGIAVSLHRNRNPEVRQVRGAARLDYVGDAVALPRQQPASAGSPRVDRPLEVEAAVGAAFQVEAHEHVDADGDAAMPAFRVADQGKSPQQVAEHVSLVHVRIAVESPLRRPGWTWHRAQVYGGRA